MRGPAGLALWRAITPTLHPDLKAYAQNLNVLRQIADHET